MKFKLITVQFPKTESFHVMIPRSYVKQQLYLLNKSWLILFSVRMIYYI